MKIYLSGPITGTKDYMNRFDKAEQRLAERGQHLREDEGWRTRR